MLMFEFKIWNFSVDLNYNFKLKNYNVNTFGKNCPVFPPGNGTPNA